MKRIVVRHLGVGSVAKYFGAAHAILGVLYGIAGLFAGLAAVIDYDDFTTWHKVTASIGVALVSFIVVPAVAFLIGWLYGAVLTLIVNFIFQTSKGIELDVEEEKK